jgi:L-fuconolactonase
MNRRQFTTQALAATAALASGCEHLRGAPNALIIDTHQHLWDRNKLLLPWLAQAPAVLQRDFTPEDYAKAVGKRRVRAIYTEVDVANTHLTLEADQILELIAAGDSSTVAATIGGRPAWSGFKDWITPYAKNRAIKGLRQVLHTPASWSGQCLQPTFIAGVRTLGELRLNFELTMRPTELMDADKLAEACPDTSFVLDHCGNGDPKAFCPRLAPELPRSCRADVWKRGIDALAARDNVVCKISGICAFLPPDQWKAEHLAPVVNHCLDAFGPKRVMFGGDWPVCLLGGELDQWIKALEEIVSCRSAADQRALWSGNAMRVYRLSPKDLT